MTSNQRIAQIAIVVKDYDEAIEFYTKKLSFTLVEDTQLTSHKRWVVIALAGNTNSCNILLAKANNEQQMLSIGNQTGGRVFLFLHTNNFEKDYKQMQNNGIEFIGTPRDEPYGKVVVFKDLYGNLWDFIEPLNSIV